MNLLPAYPILPAGYGATSDDVRTSGERHVVDLLPPSPLVYDVGAHVGEWATMLLEARPDARLRCYEPCPRARARLVERLAAFGYGDRVLVSELALGEVAEVASLYEWGAGSGMSSLIQREFYRAGQPAAVMPAGPDVTVRPLAAVLGADEVVDLLKVDVEGGELDVLVGAGDALRDGRLRAVQFEGGGCWIDARVYFRDFWRLLSPRYDLHRVTPAGLVAVEHYVEALEVFTSCNYLARWRA